MIDSTLTPALPPRLTDDLRRGRALLAQRQNEIEQEFRYLATAVSADRDLGRVDIWPRVNLHCATFTSGLKLAAPRTHLVTLSLDGFMAIRARFDRLPTLGVSTWTRASFRPSDPETMWEILPLVRGESRLCGSFAEALALAEIQTDGDGDDTILSPPDGYSPADQLRAMHGERQAQAPPPEILAEMERKAGEEHDRLLREACAG